jgi:hypothetical protein
VIINWTMKNGDIWPLESIHLRMAETQLVMNGITMIFTKM